MKHLEGDIERHFAGGLPPAREEALREHLRSCDACRQVYDEIAVVVRGLHGASATPTEAEVEAAAARAIEAWKRAGGPPEEAVATRVPATRWRLPLAAAAMVAAGFAVLMVVPAEDWPGTKALRPPPGPVVAGATTEAQSVTVGGVSVGKGARILDGQPIVVQSDGLAILQLAQGRASVRTFPGSKLSTARAGSQIQLEVGRVWCDVEQRSGGAPFTVVTSEGTVDVVGTSFIVERRAGRTDVRVVKGLVKVRGGGDMVTVATERQTSIQAGAPPTPPRRYSPDDDVAAWRNVLQGFFDEVQKAFQLGVKQLEDLLP